ncbi:MAG TPA: hypothetical protein ENK05_06675 [Gammaproteobacteria bacterium]|nr:hypothetical protein [Gammaproteobacteria bacterium]
MSRFELDTAALRRPLNSLLLILVAVAILLWTSIRYLDGRQAQLRQARSDLNILRSEYRRAVEAGGILQTSRKRYEELRLRGFVGKEPRLRWIESLRNSGRDVELYNLRYTLRQRRPIHLNGHDGEHYQLFGSPMQLHLDLLHEGRLVDFFGALDDDRAAVYQLRSCTMVPDFSGATVAADKANVSADCDMIWYTVDRLQTVEEDPI